MNGDNIEDIVRLNLYFQWFNIKGESFMSYRVLLSPIFFGAGYMLSCGLHGFAELWEHSFVAVVLTILLLIYAIERKRRLRSETMRNVCTEISGALWQNTEDGLLWVRLDGVILRVNKKYCRMSGYSEKELQSLRIDDLEAVMLSHEQIQEKAKEIVAKGYDRFESKHRRKDGSIFDVEISASSLSSGEVISFVRDISDRKVQEERWMRAIDSAGDGVWDWNLQSGKVYFSNQWKLMVGYDADELSGDVEEWSERLHPDDHAATMSAINKYLIGESAVYMNEQRLRCRDGTYKWILDRGQVIEWDSEGTPLRMVGTHADITQRKEIEVSLRESETRFRSIFNSMTEMVAWHDLVCAEEGIATPIDYRITDCNPAFTAHTGIAHEEAVGKLGSELYGTGSAPYLEEFSEVAITGSPKNLELYFEPMDKYFLVSVVSPVSGQFVTITTDISGRVQQEKEIKLLNRLYRVLSQVSQAIVRAVDIDSFIKEACQIIVDEGGFLLAWVGKLEEDMSVTSVEACGRAHSYADGIVVRADDRIEGQGPSGIALREGVSCVQNGFMDAKSTAFWRERASAYGIESSAAFPIKVRGKVWGGLMLYSDQSGFFNEKYVELLEKVANDMGFALDNLEREKKRQEVEEALRVNEAKMVSIFHAAPIGIGLAHNRVMSEVNDKFCEMVHYSRDELVGQSSRILYADQKDFDYVGQEKYRRMGILGTGTVATRFKRKDGKIIDVLLSSTPIDPKDLSAGVTFTALDITEQKRIEEEKHQLQHQLLQSQKMESVGRLAGGIAHDFNNMLSVILGHTELASAALGSNHVVSSDLQEILKVTHRSANLVRQLLAFARKQTVNPKVLQINDTIEGMLKMVRRLIGEDIELNWVPGDDLWLVKIDPAQVDQVLANLCVNARDAILGVGKITITTSNLCIESSLSCGVIPGEYVLISICDNGCGMDKVILENLFEPFFTTKSVGKGTGLGLATVYGIVKQNDGFIDVESAIGEGTTFRIYIPRVVSDLVEGEEIEQNGVNAKGDETILLVEDEVSILELCKRMLLEQGYSVIAASNPLEALQKVKEHKDRIDLVVTDVIMPDMNGKELVDNLRDIISGFESIFTSGYTGDVIAQRGIIPGKFHFLQKPFSVKKLVAKVREVLDAKGS
jgi:PAS domain S-box-containing protein